MRVMYIDDDEDDRALFMDAVNSYDDSIEVILVRDCEEALMKLKQQMSTLPDFLVLDLNMPKINGIECLKMLKADERFRAIPVIVCTTARDPNQLRKVVKLGALDFIIKASHFDKYVGDIQRILTKEYPSSSE